MKGQFPFKLGCTSYIYPADIIPNVKQMAGFVDDIELLFYEWSEKTLPLTPDSCRTLNEIAQEQGISYTVHLPIYFPLHNTKQAIHNEYLTKIIEILVQTADLSPYAYILHLEGIHFTSPAQEINQWQAASHWLCESLATSSTVKAVLARTSNNLRSSADGYKKICVENLNYPLGWHTKLATDFNFSLCLDIGHLWKYQPEEWLPLVQTALPKTRVIHLHGVKAQQDHISLKESDPDKLKALLEVIRKSYNHVLTLEVFNEKNIFESLALVNELWQN